MLYIYWILENCFVSRFHILAGEPRGDVLDNSFNGGICKTVKSIRASNPYRVPANLETVNFEVWRCSMVAMQTLHTLCFYLILLKPNEVRIIFIYLLEEGKKGNQFTQHQINICTPWTYNFKTCSYPKMDYLLRIFSYHRFFTQITMRQM